MSRVKDICRVYGISSTRELCRMLNNQGFSVTPATIGNIENPNVKSTWCLILKLADIFGVSTGYLMEQHGAISDQEKILEGIMCVQDDFFRKMKQLELEEEAS